VMRSQQRVEPVHFRGRDRPHHHIAEFAKHATDLPEPGRKRQSRD
jgi:hypothetical protein